MSSYEEQKPKEFKINKSSLDGYFLFNITPKLNKREDMNDFGRVDEIIAWAMAVSFILYFNSEDFLWLIMLVNIIFKVSGISECTLSRKLSGGGYD